MKISVLGSGYVGLVAGVCFSEAGHDVTCIDSNLEKIEKLKSGEVPFFEPGLGDLFKKNKKRMRFEREISAGINGSEVVFIAVGTPEGPDGQADMGPTMSAFKDICADCKSDLVLVLKSTVPIGTAKKLMAMAPSLTKHRIDVVNNPEFLRQGSAVQDFLDPDRVVLGLSGPSALAAMERLYHPFLKDKPNGMIVMDNTSAEMTKYAANSFLALKISFINEIALLADQLGADIEKVKLGFTSDHRINPAFFNPGIGYGGSCFPKDIRALKQTGKENQVELLLLEACDAVNERQKSILARRLHDHLGDLKGKTIGIWGLAFKANTDDVRRAPSLAIIQDLVNSGAKVKAYDPVAGENAKKSSSVKFELVDDRWQAIDGSDALVIVTEWTEFKTAELETIKKKLKSPVVFDGRNIFDPSRMKQMGFKYFDIGRHSSLD